jgi:hypothetical protein
MVETAPLTAQAWENFYIIVGSTAGALIGLQFVVLTLISESVMIRSSGESLAAFGSPNVVHFCAALLVSAIFSAPWHGLGPPGFAVALAGACGFVYSIAVLRRAMRQRDYKPVLEDWIWHAALPILAYANMVHAGMRLSRSADALFLVGGSVLLLVFIGIHNAWDTVMYVTLERSRELRTKAESNGEVEQPSAAESASTEGGVVVPSDHRDPGDRGPS